MLYIISGTSRSGKTIVSQKLMDRTGIPYLPVDVMVMGFTNGMPEIGIHDKLWPNEIATRMWPFLSAMIENILWSETDFILDGEAFLPHNLRALCDKHPDKIQAVFMGYAETDSTTKIKQVKTFTTGPGDWLIRESDEYLEDHINNMIKYSKMIKDECHTYNMPYFDVSADFNDTIANILASFKT